MLLAFTFILLAIWIWILVSVYSIFFPFIKNLSNIDNNNIAYYWAISSIERAQLSIRYHSPWFSWSWWYLADNNRWPISDAKSWYFGMINNNPNWMFWTVNSKTYSIPSPWNWNVEYLLASEDSSNYNMIDYKNLVKLNLSIDNTSEPKEYYTYTDNITYFDWWSFTWAFRLPPKVSNWFWWENLCIDVYDPICNRDWDNIWDDILINRWIYWYNNWSSFQIIPNISVLYYSWMHIDQSQDIAIRKAIINNTWLIHFWQDSSHYSPIDTQNPWYWYNNLSWNIVISNNPQTMETINYKNILSNSNSYTWLEIYFWLINPLITPNYNIYPFLEYQFYFPDLISDNFYTIQWVWQVWDYNIKINILKPSNKWSVAWSFTVIF